MPSLVTKVGGVAVDSLGGLCPTVCLHGYNLTWIKRRVNTRGHVNEREDSPPCTTGSLRVHPHVDLGYRGIKPCSLLHALQVVSQTRQTLIFNRLHYFSFCHFYLEVSGQGILPSITSGRPVAGGFQPFGLRRFQVPSLTSNTPYISRLERHCTPGDRCVLSLGWPVTP